jgi:hypothetical protein
VTGDVLRTRGTLVMAVLRLALPSGHERWRPDPFPGSDDAERQGCTCPILQPWPGFLSVDDACPVHEIEKGFDA